MKRTKSLPALAVCIPLLFAFTHADPIRLTPPAKEACVATYSVHDFKTTTTFYTNKKTKTMIIEKQIRIEKDIESAWQVLGPQFADAYKWASAVSHSEGKGGSFQGATCSERGCATSMGALQEKLLQYSAETHSLTYQVAEGMPSMVKYATNSWQLSSLGNGQTQLSIRIEMQTGGLMGSIMKPMMKMKMTKIGEDLIEEFKYYVENGKPHPRKLKALKKAGQRHK